jgi:hypothetical protein
MRAADDSRRLTISLTYENDHRDDALQVACGRVFSVKNRESAVRGVFMGVKPAYL